MANRHEDRQYLDTADEEEWNTSVPWRNTSLQSRCSSSLLLPKGNHKNNSYHRKANSGRRQRLSMLSMEALYTSLRNEIQSFEEHIRHCQHTFDLHTLFNVLRLLFPEDGGIEEIQSMEQLQKLVEPMDRNGQDIVSITAGCKKSDVLNYISWFVSYMKYLSNLKEMFDAKVVFLLCENLYVNDDALDALPFGYREGRFGSRARSIAHTAKQLFAVRRKWALLLKRNVIDEHIFSPQSLIDLQAFANTHPFVKIIRLVPDLFHKSLATATLAREWVELHASQHNSQPPHLDTSSTGKHNYMEVASLKQQGRSVPICTPELSKCQAGSLEIWCQTKDSSSNDGSTCIRTLNQEKNELHETHEELMSLLWREQRSWTLETEIQEVNLRISDLQLQQETKKQALEALKQQLEADNCRVPNKPCQTLLCELDVLEKQLKLEQYCKSIMLGDWLLELEARPILVRPIHRLQEHHQKLVNLFQGRKEICQDLQPASGMDSHLSCNSGNLNGLHSCS